MNKSISTKMKSICPNCKFGSNFIVNGLCENCRDVVKKCNNCNNYIPLNMECYICEKRNNKVYDVKKKCKNLESEILLIKKDIEKINEKYDKLLDNQLKINIDNLNIGNKSTIPAICSDNNAIGYLYIIKEREFYRLNENIYKIGCTNDMKKRFSQYPKGSFLLFFVANIKYREIEKIWIKQLNIIPEIKKRKDIGSEYFEGNYITIIKELTNLLI